MPTANPPTTGTDALFNLLLMGLTWLRLERPDILARRGASVFGTLHSAQLITEGQRLSIAGNASLISRVMSNAQTLKVNRVPPRTQLLAQCEDTRFPLIMIVKPARALVQYDRVVGPKGYLLVVTAVGMQMAGEAAAEYSALIDAASFEAAWQRYKARMSAIGARAKRSRSADQSTPAGYHSLSAGVTDRELAGRIASAPEATQYTEDDDW